MAFWEPKPSKPAVPSAQSLEATTQTLEERYQALVKSIGRTPAIDLAIKVGDLILEHAVVERASDVHFESQLGQLRIRFRVDGILHDALVFQKNQELPITQRFRVMAGFDPEPATTFRAEEGRFQKMIAGRAIQIRVSSFPTIDGEKLVLRVLDRKQLGLDITQLGMDTDTLTTLRKLIRSPYGIFFITGSTGSGKTTSLYAMLGNISTPSINIITLEDPVEYRLSGINQAQINPKSGFTWGEGMRTILRQDPNVIMVGETRDHETAEICMRAALTGHLIFTTLHTVSACGVVERLFEMGIQPFLIASSMLGSMAQRLVRKLCPQCSQPAAPPSESVVNEFAKALDPIEAKRVKEIIYRQGGQYKLGKGCPACKNTGFLGRMGIFEILLMNEEIRKQVLANSSTDVIHRTAIKSGMKTLLMDGIENAWSGQTTLSEVIRVTATMV